MASPSARVAIYTCSEVTLCMPVLRILFVATAGRKCHIYDFSRKQTCYFCPGVDKNKIILFRIIYVKIKRMKQTFKSYHYYLKEALSRHTVCALMREQKLYHARRSVSLALVHFVHVSSAICVHN